MAKWKKEVAEGRNPRDIKVAFAQEIVARFHSKADAERALADFEARFRQGAMPDEMPEFTLPAEGGGLSIVQALKQAELTASTSEAMRMIGQGGVKADGEKVSDKGLVLAKGETVVLQVGKRKFARVTVA
jgi:tyrosyl-tRNA synthetase